MLTKTKVLASNYIIRDGYGDFPDNTGDFTILALFKYPATAAGYMEILSLFSGAADFSDPYLFIGSQAGNSDVIVEIFDGSTDTASTAVAIVNGTQNWVAVTCNVTTHIQTLIVNGVSIGTLNFNLSAIVWDKLTLLGDASAGGNTEALSVAYCRAWSSILTGAQLTAEVASINAVVTSGLIWDCPLQTSIDLTSHNNTLNQLVGVGTVTTDTTDPLLSIIAAPPTNTSPATALDLTTDSAQIWDTLSGGFADTVWGKYTAVTGDKVIGLCGFAGTSNHYRVQTRVYDGLANANGGTLYLNIGTSATAPVQFPVTVGNTYYFRFLAVGGGVTAPAILEVSLLKGLDLPAPAGSIAVNDDVDGFPLALLDVNTGYPLRFILDFPASEGAIAITTGNVLTADEGAADLKLFSYNFQTILATITLADVDEFTKISANPSNQFLVGTNPNSATHSKLRFVSSSGNLDSTVFDLGSAQEAFAIGLNIDSTIAYYVDDGFNSPIKKWDLINNVALANFITGIGADYANGKDIYIMSNGAIIIPYTSDTNDKIIAYNAAGAVQHTYDFGVFSGFHNGQDDRVFSAIDEPNSFWAWIRYENGISRFFNIKYSDGSYLSEIEAIQYENGIYQGVLTDTFIRFGHSESCPAWITRVAVGAVAIANSGLYTVSGTGAIDAAKVASGEGTGAALIRHDQNWIDTSLGTSENVKIPDPYYDTFLAGDE